MIGTMVNVHAEMDAIRLLFVPKYKSAKNTNDEMNELKIRSIKTLCVVFLVTKTFRME
jgi:hypothetical protein